MVFVLVKTKVVVSDFFHQSRSRFFVSVISMQIPLYELLVVRKLVRTLSLLDHTAIFT